MEEEKYQKELFEFKKPKRTFPRLSDLLPKGDFENRIAITLTLERIVFIIIGLIMLMVIIYAFGVEAGRGIAKKAASSSESRISLVKAPQIPALGKPAAPAQKYVIYAASFTRQEYAAQELKRLRSSGFDAYLTQNPAGGVYRLCIGSYASKDAARNELLRVQRVHKGAYIKVR